MTEDLAFDLAIAKAYANALHDQLRILANQTAALGAPSSQMLLRTISETLDIANAKATAAGVAYLEDRASGLRR
jgi:hypothetical protein